MKNFEDFSKNITPDEMESIINKSIITIISRNADENTTQDKEGRSLKLQTELSFSISMELLRRYHEWVNDSSEQT